MKVTCIQNELLQSATYLFDGYLVDCGDSEKVIQALEGKELKGIFLTHCHQDHIYGIEKVLTQFPHAKVYCSQKTWEGLKDDKLNLSYIIPEHFFCFTQDENVVVLEEGVHTIGGMKVEVISTPGHSEDCLSFIIKDCIFTGDSYIPFAKVFTKWPTSNKALALENEARLKEIAETRKLKVFPGHWTR